MNVESNAELIEVGNDIHILINVFTLRDRKRSRQIHDRDDCITRHVNSFNARMSIGYRCRSLVRKDLFYLGNVNAVMIVSHLKLEDFQLVGSAFKQNIGIHTVPPFNCL